MPLVKKEIIGSDKIWGLWKIEEDHATLLRMLQAPECDQKKLETIKNASKQLEFLASRNAIKSLLSDFQEEYPGTENDPYGRAYLCNHRFFISLSHSHGYAAAILSMSEKVGIDIEMIQDKITRIVHKYLKTEEISHDLHSLTLSWCVKEVMYKIYSEKQLSLRDEIHLHPFEFSREGICEAHMNPEPGKIYRLKYLEYDQHIIAFNS